MSVSAIILALGALYFSAHFLAFVFDKTKIPDILVLMSAGVLAGPVFHLVTPADFGRAGEVATTIALAVILFESGTTLSLAAIRNMASPLTALALSTFVFSIAAVTALSMLFFELPLGLALATGAILGGTSGAVVIPMVRSLKLSDRAGTLLILESALTDVLCIVFALALLDAFQKGTLELGLLAGNILLSLSAASVIGILGGLAWLLALNFVRRFQSTTFTTIAFAFVLYGVSDLLGLSGAITTLAFGIAIANAPAKIRTQQLTSLTLVEKAFFQEMVFLLKTFFFLYLGISIKITSLWPVLAGMLAVLVIYMGRLWITKYTVSNKLEPLESSYVTALIPKGLAAAVLAGIPLQREIPQGEVIQMFAYSVVLSSVCLTALLIPLVTRAPFSRYLRGFFRALPAPLPAAVRPDPAE